MAGNLKPLVLHAHATGPNPYKIGILLEELGLPYSVKQWDFSDSAGGVKGPKFLAINENGRVPALEDPNTGVVSWESGAVMNYLLRTYDKSSKFHPAPSADAQHVVDYDKWTFFLVSTLGPMLGQTNWYRHYNATKNEDALKRYSEQTYRCFGVLEGQLKKSNGASVLPEGYSALDMHFYPWVYQYGFAGLSLDDYPLVSRWLKSTGERTALKAAYKKVSEGEAASG